VTTRFARLRAVVRRVREGDRAMRDQRVARRARAARARGVRVVDAI